MMEILVIFVWAPGLLGFWIESSLPLAWLFFHVFPQLQTYSNSRHIGSVCICSLVNQPRAGKF